MFKKNKKLLIGFNLQFLYFIFIFYVIITRAYLYIKRTLLQALECVQLWINYFTETKALRHYKHHKYKKILDALVCKIGQTLPLYSPNTFKSWSSQIAYCLFLGSCSSLSLITAHNFLTTSWRGITSAPTTSASSGDNLKDFVKADFLPRPPPPPPFLAGLCCDALERSIRLCPT